MAHASLLYKIHTFSHVPADDPWPRIHTDWQATPGQALRDRLLFGRLLVLYSKPLLQKQKQKSLVCAYNLPDMIQS